MHSPCVRYADSPRKPWPAAFLVSEETMAQRLVRAKKKIRDAGIPYEIPEPPLFNQRIQGVLAVVYGVFTEGYARDGRK